MGAEGRSGGRRAGRLALCLAVCVVSLLCGSGCGRIPAGEDAAGQQGTGGEAGREAEKVPGGAGGVSGLEEPGLSGAGVSGGAGSGASGASGSSSAQSAAGPSGSGVVGGLGGGGGSGVSGVPGPAPGQSTGLPALSVQGAQLVDASGSPVQLRGISTHGLAWYPEYVNEECFRQLREEWGVDVIRLAMYTAESGGYCTDGSQEELKNLVRAGVRYATECGLYVIIDWHILSDGNPNTYLEESRAFFEEMSREYADYTNVMYEICNEPNGGTSWEDIKSYASQVIEVIRKNDEDGIILVGTPNWSQYLDQAASDSLEDYDNIMYTLHFYAATHTDALRGTLESAVEKGLPVFVSEFGICDASGSGAVNTEQADKWTALLDAHRISYVAWNLSDKQETSALLRNGCGRVSGFTQEDLSESGKWLYSLLKTPGGAETAGEAGLAGESGAETAMPPAEESTAPTPEKDVPGDSGAPGGDGDIKAELVNSWGQGGESYYQYTVTITNSGGGDRNGWKVILEFDGEISLSGGWNGNYQADGSTLTISSMDYNGFLGEGSSVGDIGFILKGAEGLEVLAASLDQGET